MEQVKRLNLGCGKDLKKREYIIRFNYKPYTLEGRDEWVELDCLNLPGVDVVHDLEKPLPFKKNYFSEVYASHILEHIKNFIQLMEEIHRVCKPGAIIKIKVPYFASASAFQDPTHVRFFTLKTFNYFLPKNENNFITKARFKILRKKIKWTRKNWIINKPLEWLVNSLQRGYERFFCFIIPFQELELELEVIK